MFQDPINKFDLDGRCWGGGDYCHPWKKIKQAASWANDHVVIQAQGCLVGFCAGVSFNHGRVFGNAGVSGGNWMTRLGRMAEWGVSGGYTSTPLDQTNQGSAHGCLFYEVGGCISVGSRGKDHHRHATWTATAGVGMGFAYGISRQSNHSWRWW